MSKGPSALRLENDGEVVVSTHSPTGFGPIQIAAYLTLTRWQFDQARRRGLIPDPALSLEWVHWIAF
jgi:hypothetical protein